MVKIKAVVFDLDGTLLNTLDNLHAATNHVLARYAMPPRTKAEVRRFVGDGGAKLIQRAVPAGTSQELTDRVFADWRVYYGAHSLESTAPYPGIAEGLRALKDRGVRMAVVSNKIEPAVESLRQHFFADTVDVAVGDVPGRPVKPAPDGTLAALARLGVAPAEALFVGDSDVDYQTGKNAGMMTLTAAWGYRDRDFLLAQGVEAVADTPTEAFTYILERV